MSVFQVKLPACTYAGIGSLRKIEEIILKEGVKSILLFTDKGVQSTGLLDLLIMQLEKLGAAYQIVDDLTPEPAYTDVQRVLEQVQDTTVDLVVAVGGGSVMDAAKLVSILKGASYTIRELLEDASVAKKCLKTVMVPTTCGTGAEATCNAIVAIPEQQTKKGIVNDNMIPDYVILDPEMIHHLPAKIVAATGVDALAHVVECYTSKKATPFSNTYALAGAKLIFKNIEVAYKDPEDMEAKSKMMLGAYYGGVAITASGTTAVHALSYPLGGKYHIAHGVSNAILFAHVMEYNQEACCVQLAELCDGVYPEKIDLSQNEKAKYIVEQIARIVKITDIPTDLSQFGVNKEDLEFLVEAGSQQTRLLVNNRRELSQEDIREIYKKVLR